MEAEPRLVQVARMFGRPVQELDADSARKSIEEDPDTIAAALFEEAAASDDVVSVESALSYLGLRMDYLGDLVGDGSRVSIENGYRRRLLAWER